MYNLKYVFLHVFSGVCWYLLRSFPVEAPRALALSKQFLLVPSLSSTSQVHSAALVRLFFVFQSQSSLLLYFFISFLSSLTHLFSQQPPSLPNKDFHREEIQGLYNILVKKLINKKQYTNVYIYKLSPFLPFEFYLLLPFVLQNRRSSFTRQQLCGWEEDFLGWRRNPNCYCHRHFCQRCSLRWLYHCLVSLHFPTFSHNFWHFMIAKHNRVRVTNFETGENVQDATVSFPFFLLIYLVFWLKRLSFWVQVQIFEQPKK